MRRWPPSSDPWVAPEHLRHMPAFAQTFLHPARSLLPTCVQPALGLVLVADARSRGLRLVLAEKQEPVSRATLLCVI